MYIGAGVNMPKCALYPPFYTFVVGRTMNNGEDAYRPVFYPKYDAVIADAAGAAPL